MGEEEEEEPWSLACKVNELIKQVTFPQRTVRKKRY